MAHRAAVTTACPLPRPRQAAFAEGRVPAGRLQAVGALAPKCSEAVERLNRWLGRRHGKPGPNLPLRLAVADARCRRPVLGDDESYRLRISPTGVAVSAATLAGFNWALATLAQLVDRHGCLPVAEIEDAPAFPWRGLMLDPARRFISLETLGNTLDAMALHKLNVLHLHLSDDQGFRLRSAAFPKLAGADSYSPDELRTLVAQATERSIRVVPELDMPGHVTSWLCTYPEWGPRRAPVAPSNRFGPHPAVLNPADEAVYAAIDVLLGELAEVFPDEFVHIGGDEVDATWWRESEEVASYMASHGLANADALQAHFIARVAELAARRGKRVIAWDEALDGMRPENRQQTSTPPIREGWPQTGERAGQLRPTEHRQEEAPCAGTSDGGASGTKASTFPQPSNLWVQAWRGATARGRALAVGRPCILSSGYYLDLFYPADLHHGYAPDAAEEDLLAQEDALLDDPRLRHVAAGLRWTQVWREPAQRQHSSGGAVQGGEACLWSELVSDELLPVRLWSRMPALADRFWTNQQAPGNLSACVEASLDRLAQTGIVDVQGRSRELLRAFGVSERQLTAVELLEPVKWYARLLGDAALKARIQGATMPQARPYQADTPLNRPIDALLPESFAAARFQGMLAQGGAPLVEECRRLLAICEETGFARELIAPIQSLALVLQTVIDHAQGSIDADAARRRALQGGEPQGEYLVAIAPMVEEWLTSA